MGTTPAFVPNRDAWDNPLNSYYTLSNVEPVAQTGGPWEMVYNHYANLQGLSAPNTASVVNSPGYQPEPVTYSDSGPGTLLYTRSAGDTDPVTSAPVTPIILSSYGTSSGILLRWVGSVGATSYTIQRSTTSGGPYSTIGTVSGESTYSYTDTSASGAGTPYYYIVTASNNYGQSAPGAEARASVGLPEPWANGDLGTLGLGGAGGSDYLGASSFTLRASGAVVGNSSATEYYDQSNTVYNVVPQSVTPMTDSMQFAYIAMNGDGQIVARVNAPLSPVTSSAGLMMRSSLNSDDAMIANMVQYNGLASTTSRTASGVAAVTSGPVSISTAATALADSSSLLVAPYWVQLTRAGNTFTASVSANNVNWTQVSQQTITMPATIYAGLALASGNTTLPTTATFDEVRAPGWTQAPTVPAAPANLTAVAAKGVQLTWSAPVGATSYTIQRNGVNMASVAAPVAGLYASAPGTMYYIDYTAAAGSTNTYAVSASGAGGTGSLSAIVSAVAPAVTAPFLADSVGIPYVVGTVGVPLTYQVGLAGVGTFSATGLPGGLTINSSTGTISGTPTQSGLFNPVVTATNAAGLDSWTYAFTIVGAALPVGMQQVDIGFLQAPGIAGTSGGTIVNTGTGSGPSTVCDVLHFAYYQLTGDGSIVVNLNSVTTASSATTLAATGIMMRNTLTCDSQMIDAHSGIGGSTALVSAYRSAANAGVFDYLDGPVVAGTNLTLPAHLQITRSGNTFTSSYSTDGSTWNVITSQTIGMNPTVYVGLDAAPVDSSVSNTSTGTYSNLAITSASAALINSPSTANGTVGAPFSFTITSAILPATYGATALPPGLSLNASTGIISGIPTSAGNYTVTASAVNGVASGSASLLITIGHAMATVTLGELSPTYDGSPESTSVTTSPAGLAVGLTYNGSATAPTTAGSYTVIATINDPNYAGSATGTLVIAKALAATTFSANPASPIEGRSEALTATVAGAGQPGGTVVFTSGASTLCTATLNASGVATCSFVPTGSGSETLTAQYQGDANHLTSSATTTLFVYDPAVVLQSASTQLVYPGATNITVCVTPATSATATGIAQIYDGTTLLTTRSLQGGGCAYWYISPGLNAGTHSLTAVYSGDNNNVGGTSVPVTVTVSPVPVTLSASCWNASFAYGGSYTCTVSLSSNAGSAQGSLSYVVDGGSINSVTISNGSAQFSVPTPNAGNHSVTISDAAQGNFAAAAPVTESFTVTQAPTQVQLTPSSYDQPASTPLTLTASLTSWSASVPMDGTVAFYDGTTLLGTLPAGATASFHATGLSAGTQAFSAVYLTGPSGNYASANSSTVNVQLN
ncbi:Ig-like domain repeat protein [Granulicella arctica]|uniref:F0F1-type ATP synthase membrane subunit c/vacuolar-type H+-ATPase subunit K n=1 Tax=Granulicella arctica TaxID=940613 RepID=A0A7Y9PDJ4_9BACT|nr:Ig-like domain repeat protein [Granulicella arctica]NYF77947.1 F0F1-type ATP synthase membrane subunit c/vacuolar-type H+-ATPase subunit K [Granulicella arctica]